MKSTTQYPETYCFIRNNRDGESWIVPIRPNRKLDLKKIVKKWNKDTFQGLCSVSGFQSYPGEYSASIFTDGRSPESNVVWESKDFFLE